ncbi:MAG TPA: ABC transporter permease [Bryobacteraceae bacterium]|jgi:putative ABC transport system permease protein|nr:ABC transporter permease [Bryobacteraceae bacterium]
MRWLDDCKQDVIYALRTFARTPGFSLIVIITLALGIGATSAVFTIVNAVILHPLPYPNPDRLVVVWEKRTREPQSPPVFDSYTDFKDWQAQSHSFERLAPATWATGGKILTGSGRARTVLAMPVGIEFFPLLGATTAAGRLFQQDDVRRECTLVLKYQFWKTAFGGEDNIAGRHIDLNDKSCTIVGVTSPAFAFYPDAISMWMLITPASEIIRDPDNANVGVFGLLKPGVSKETAQHDLAAIYSNRHRNDSHSIPRAPVVYSLAEQFDYLTGPNLRLSIILLFAAVACVLFIACLNIANLLLGRSLARQKELAVRASLGSGRVRLIRQLLTECLLLSFAGTLAGIWLAVCAVHYFSVLNPVQMPPGSSVSVNLFVLAFAAVLAIVTALVFGLIPAFKASRIDLIHALKATSQTASLDPSARKFGQILVSLEVSLSLALLTGAALLIQSVNRLSSVPLGFDTSRSFTIPVELPGWSYAKPVQGANFYRDALRRITALPGIESAAFVSSLPLNSGRWGQYLLTVEGRPAPNPAFDASDTTQPSVTPEYFKAMGVPLRQGRLFDERDRADTEPVAIVNEALARKYFPHRSPIGAHIKVGDSPAANPWLTIVGVVANEIDKSFFNEMSFETIPSVFRPIDQQPPQRASLLVHTGSPELLSAVMIQSQLASLDGSVAVGEVETMNEHVVKQFAYPRFRAGILSMFAALALLLAAVGLYGVLSHGTAQRTQEFGIRMALGAHKRDVLALVIRQGLLLTAVGIGGGLVLALLLTRLLGSLLYAITPTDPVTLVGVSLLLLLVSLLATYVPARRAASVDPIQALKYE